MEEDIITKGFISSQIINSDSLSTTPISFQGNNLPIILLLKSISLYDTRYFIFNES